MARTAGRKNRPSDKLPPFTQFERSSSIDQLCIYYYWLYIITDGVEGWDIKKGGFKEHWKQYGLIKDNFSYNSFYQVGKVSWLCE